jgi:hypothetical protein
MAAAAEAHDGQPVGAANRFFDFYYFQIFLLPK